jgi:hypothetical protein
VESLRVAVKAQSARRDRRDCAAAFRFQQRLGERVEVGSPPSRLRERRDRRRNRRRRDRTPQREPDPRR